MFIEVITKSATKILTATENKKLYTIMWDNLVKDKKRKMISEFVYFDCSINLKYKKTKKEPKVIFLGEYNQKFWFFKIIKKIKNNSYQFEIKKPVYDNVENIQIFIIDWYDVIKELKINKFEVEYAISNII